MRVADIMSRKRSRFSDESSVFRNFLRSKQDSGTQSQEVVSTAFLQILQRKPTVSESARYEAFLKKNTKQLGREKGLQTTLSALLLHPKAVFRFELGRGDPDKQGRVRLAPAELAYAIAFALTDRAPDKELLSAAHDGSLSNARGVRTQAMRLMNDGKIQTPRLLRFFQEFFGYTKAPQVFKDQATKRKARLGGNYRPEVLVADTDNLILTILDRDRDVLKQLLTIRESFVSSGPALKY